MEKYKDENGFDSCHSQEVLSVGKKKRHLSEREAVVLARQEVRDRKVVPVKDMISALEGILEKAKKDNFNKLWNYPFT